MYLILVLVAFLSAIPFPLLADTNTDNIMTGFRHANHQAFLNTNPSSQEIDNYETQEKLDDLQYEVEKLREDQGNN